MATQTKVAKFRLEKPSPSEGRHRTKKRLDRRSSRVFNNGFDAGSEDGYGDTARCRTSSC
jgi:hypothetical protein